MESYVRNGQTYSSMMMYVMKMLIVEEKKTFFCPVQSINHFQDNDAKNVCNEYLGPIQLKTRGRLQNLWNRMWNFFRMFKAGWNCIG